MAGFGGDPDRMVIWGHSAGSVDVDYYSFTYPEDPIVKGLIMDSGTAAGPAPKNDRTSPNFTFVVENVGCVGLAGDFKQQLDFMRSIDAIVIEDFSAS